MASRDQPRIERVARALGPWRKYAALRYEMTKYSLTNQSRIERVARALYDATPFEEFEEGQPTNGSAEPKNWDDLDEVEYPIKQEFRVMATIAIEAMNDELDEGLRQFQLPAVLAELTSLSKPDALRVLNAAIERIMESPNK